MDIENEIDLIYNTLQSGNLDEAFIQHNNLMEKTDLSYENRLEIDLVYARLLLELGEYDKSHDIMVNLYESKDKLKGETIRLAIDVYYAISQAFTGRILEARGKIGEIENLIPKLKKINIQNSKALLSELHNVKGIIDFRNGNMDSALNEYNTSINLSKEINFRKDEARTLFNIASLHEQQGDLSSSITYFKRSLEIFDVLKFYEGIMPCLNRMKNIYSRLNETDEIFSIDRKIMDFQVFMQLRKCKITSSRLDYELNNQIISLIGERNNLEQRVWQLEFKMNSEMAGGNLAANVENIASEELERLKEDMTLLSQELEISLTELENVRNERDDLRAGKKVHEENANNQILIDIKNELNFLKTENITLEDEINEYNLKRGEIDLTLLKTQEELDISLTELENVKNERDELKENLTNQNAYAIEQNNVKTREELDQVTKINKSLQEEIKELKENSTMIEGERIDKEILAKKEDEIAKLQNKYEKNSQELEELRIKIDKVTSNYQSQMEELRVSFKIRNEELTEENKQLKDLIAGQETKTDDVEIITQEIEDLKKNNENLSIEFSNYKKSRDSVQSKFQKQITDLKAENDEKVRKMIDLENEMQNTDEEYDRKCKERDVFATELKELQAKYEVLITQKPDEEFRKEYSDLKINYKQKSSDFNQLAEEFEEFRIKNTNELNELLQQKDKEIIELKTILSTLEKQEEEEIKHDVTVITPISMPQKYSSKIEPISQTVKPSEVLKQLAEQPDKKDVTPKPSAKLPPLESQTVKPSEVLKHLAEQPDKRETAKQTAKLAPLESQTVKPSELLKKQDEEIEAVIKLPEVEKSDENVDQIYHKSLDVNADSLQEYIQGDRLADNVHKFIKEAGNMQLKFLAMRIGVSPNKCMQVVENLEKIGVFEIAYSEGNENNPTIVYKS